jgi:hypothetical protein
MVKLTWKESVLLNIKNIVNKTGSNIFTLKDLSYNIDNILLDTGSISKQPIRNLDKTLRDLKDFNIIKHRPDISNSSYEFTNHYNEALIVKKRSNGHSRVIKRLETIGIPYEEEKCFEDLKHKSFLRFDIYFIFLNRKIVIEYDGAQHQKSVEIWGGEKSLNTGVYRDSIKTQYCVDNKITLFRIDHTIKNIEKIVDEFLYKIILEDIGITLLVVFICILLLKN